MIRVNETVAEGVRSAHFCNGVTVYAVGVYAEWLLANEPAVKPEPVEREILVTGSEERLRAFRVTSAGEGTLNPDGSVTGTGPTGQATFHFAPSFAESKFNRGVDLFSNILVSRIEPQNRTYYIVFGAWMEGQVTHQTTASIESLKARVEKDYPYRYGKVTVRESNSVNAPVILSWDRPAPQKEDEQKAVEKIPLAPQPPQYEIRHWYVDGPARPPIPFTPAAAFGTADLWSQVSAVARTNGIPRGDFVTVVRLPNVVMQAGYVDNKARVYVWRDTTQRPTIVLIPAPYTSEQVATAAGVPEGDAFVYRGLGDRSPQSAVAPVKEKVTYYVSNLGPGRDMQVFNASKTNRDDVIRRAKEKYAGYMGGTLWITAVGESGAVFSNQGWEEVK